ncbi:hypothetical protein AV530_019533 [Patagioenas fasciata monilis]|uniref:Uncharacterized protein n=1 Tax=Patagioenas fasciata monilis TaxID=372326 RepID=A0A1V4JEC1_PATFA|nr:hypothetical protein AV530_019533 [Patagioenas fasciata monilis]
MHSPGIHNLQLEQQKVGIKSCVDFYWEVSSCLVKKSELQLFPPHLGSLVLLFVRSQVAASPELQAHGPRTRCPVKLALYGRGSLGRIALHTMEMKSHSEVDAVFQVPNISRGPFLSGLNGLVWRDLFVLPSSVHTDIGLTKAERNPLEQREELDLHLTSQLSVLMNVYSTER